MLGVLPAVGVRVDERGVAPVILRRGIGVEGAEPAPARVEPRMERVLHAGVRIAPGLVGEREEVRHHVVPVLRVLPEALVELAPHPARHIGDDPVDGLAPVLVEIQILVGERAQQAPGLRAPIGIGPVQAPRRRMPRGRVAVLEPGHAVAQRGHGEAEHRRAHRGVRDLVQAAFLEAAVEVNARRIGNDAPGLDTGEAPARACNQGLRFVGHVSNGQDGAGLLEVRGGVGNVAAIREQELLDGRRGLKLRVDTSAEGLVLGISGLGRVHPEEAWNLRDVALPAARDHDEAALHQEAVAHVDRRIRIRARAEQRAGGPVEIRHRDRIAAVDDVEHDAPAALRAIERQQDGHVGAPLDAAGGVARGQLDVGDAAIGGVSRVDGEVQAPLQLFIGPDLSGR